MTINDQIALLRECGDEYERRFPAHIGSHPIVDTLGDLVRIQIAHQYAGLTPQQAREIARQLDRLADQLDPMPVILPFPAYPRLHAGDS